MGKVSRAAVYEVLNTVQLQGAPASLAASRSVKRIGVEEDRIQVELLLSGAFRSQEAALREHLTALLQEKTGAVALELQIEWQATPEETPVNLLPTVKHCIVVGSGKGGVGKSTVAANLACALGRLGLQTGLLDMDIHGPSMGMMFGVDDGPLGTPDGRILPVEKFGLRLMSMGFLIDEDRPVVWRGPMLNKALVQFLGDVVWGDLDVLVIDLPPGTGDVQISLVHHAKEAIQRGGAVVVSTPQDVAFLDARKAIGLFRTLELPIIGVVENMSSFLCPHCQTETQIFGHGTVRAAAEQMALPFLGEVPIDLELRKAGDEGTPLVVSHPDSPQSRIFLDMARVLKDRLAL
nr:Mrp/NBP35 family ATP-binding protein [uncultured Holophaga sp.]